MVAYLSLLRYLIMRGEMVTLPVGIHLNGAVKVTIISNEIWTPGSIWRGSSQYPFPKCLDSENVTQTQIGLCYTE